ncbi:reticulophagy regulator 3 [Ciona intestinalis]
MEGGAGDASQSDAQTNKIEKLSQKLYNWSRSYESVILYFQRLLVWEKPTHSSVFLILIHIGFWYLTARSSHAIGFLSSMFLGLVWLDMWKHKIWPEIRAEEPDPEAEWGELHPKLLSLPELCQIIAEGLVTLTTVYKKIMEFKRDFPGRFCGIFCFFCLCLNFIGSLVPGVLLAYTIMLCLLFWPLLWYNKILERTYTQVEPFLMQLQYTLKQRPATTYYMTKYLKAKKDSKSEENADDDISEFVPELDEKTAAVLARAITDDSELSETDEEILAQEIPLFSRASTPDDLTSKEVYVSSLPNQFPPIDADDSDDEDLGIPKSMVHEKDESEQPHGGIQEQLSAMKADMLNNAIKTKVWDTFNNLTKSMQQPQESDAGEQNIDQNSDSSTPSSDFEFISVDNEGPA